MARMARLQAGRIEVWSALSRSAILATSHAPVFQNSAGVLARIIHLFHFYAISPNFFGGGVSVFCRVRRPENAGRY